MFCNNFGIKKHRLATIQAGDENIKGPYYAICTSVIDVPKKIIKTHLDMALVDIISTCYN